MTSKRDRMFGFLVVSVTTVLCLLLAEVGVRVIDGYPLSALMLSSSALKTPALSKTADSVGVPAKARSYAEQIPPATGVKIEWFDQEPPRLDNKAAPAEWKAIAARLPQGTVSFDFFKLWNSRFVDSQPCQSSVFKDFPGVAFVFDPPDGSAHPRYRFIPNSVTPLGLVTNQFGFRGPDIQFKKSKNAIRIAFVGASTTVHQHNFPFSYPELIGYWLNLWALSENLGVTFEAVNLGREGISSPDMAAVVRHEAVPLQPDYVVYYEGSNQFNLATIVKNAPQRKRTGTETVDNDKRFLTALGKYSAVARRFQNLKVTSNTAAETPKPAYEVEWPAEVDEFDPPLDSLKLPLSLPTILKDLDAIRSDLNQVHSRLVLSSFNWNVHDGMKLDPVQHKSIRDYLDIGMYPYKYRDIERANRFQNRVFKKYAQLHDLPYIEVAERLSTDPDLFDDPIHENYFGVKLRAWLVLQQLVPEIRADLMNSKLPRVWNSDYEARSGPPLPRSVRTVAIGCKDLTSDTSENVLGELPLSKFYPDNSESNVEAGTIVQIRTAPKRFAYAAKIQPDMQLPTLDGSVFVVDLEVKEGAVQVGILSKDGSRFLRSEVVDSQRGRVKQPLMLRPQDHHDLGIMVIANGLDRDVSSSATIYSIRVYGVDKRSVGFLGGEIGPGIRVPAVSN